MRWTDIAIAPLGALYFGDGRPLTAGETDHGVGRFPPSPRTFQGLVRTALLREVNGLDLGPGADQDRIAALVGPPDRLPEGWQIVGPWLAEWDSETGDRADAVAPWLPRPLYLGERPGAPERSLETVEIKPLGTDMKWDLGEAVGSASIADARARQRPAFLKPAALRNLLAGSRPSDADGGLPRFVQAEPRTGLALEPGKSVARTGMLYTLGFHRFADQAGFVLRFRGTLTGGLSSTALTRGVATIGGRNRLARLLAVSNWSRDFRAALATDHLPAAPGDGDRFWLWTTTPAAVDCPWAPVLTPERIGDARATVVTAVVGRTERIGGFSLAEGCSAAVRTHVPAGSAWLIALDGGSAEDRGALLRSFHDAFPLGTDPGASAMGFGHTLVSRLPHART